MVICQLQWKGNWKMTNCIVHFPQGITKHNSSLEVNPLGQLFIKYYIMSGEPDLKDPARRGLDRLANNKADRSTIQKHRTDEHNEEYAKIYNRKERVQTEVAR